MARKSGGFYCLLWPSLQFCLARANVRYGAGDSCAAGFRPARVENLPLTTGLAATQDVVLEVGAVQEAVEVSATAVQIEARSSDMNTVVTTRPVAELPILGRDPLSFAALAPGVIPTQGRCPETDRECTFRVYSDRKGIRRNLRPLRIRALYKFQLPFGSGIRGALCQFEPRHIGADRFHIQRGFSSTAFRPATTSMSRRLGSGRTLRSTSNTGSSRTSPCRHMPPLTINLGLRREYLTPYAEKFGQIGYFDFNGTEPLTGQKGVFGLTEPGGYQENSQCWNFSPRIGLAWRAANKTVIRAGAGTPGWWWDPQTDCTIRITTGA